MVGIVDGNARMAAANVPRWRCRFTRKRVLAARSEKSAAPSLSIRSRTRGVSSDANNAGSSWRQRFSTEKNTMAAVTTPPTTVMPMMARTAD